jgi:hypothetical protein
MHTHKHTNIHTYIHAYIHTYTTYKIKYKNDMRAYIHTCLTNTISQAVRLITYRQSTTQQRQDTRVAPDAQPPRERPAQAEEGLHAGRRSAGVVPAAARTRHRVRHHTGLREARRACAHGGRQVKASDDGGGQRREEEDRHSDHL